METQRCELKLLTAHDKEDIAALYADAKTRQYLGGVCKPQGFHEKFTDLLAAHDATHLVIREKMTQHFIGLISLDRHHNGQDHEVSYQLVSSMMGRGFAHEAVQAAMAFAFTQLGFKKLVAETQTQNLPSIRLLEKLGFCLDHQLERFGAQQSFYVFTK